MRHTGTSFPRFCRSPLIVCPFLAAVNKIAQESAEHYLLQLPAAADNAAMQTEPSKAEPPKLKRRWFQFSLRTLMIGVTLLGCSPFAAADFLGPDGSRLAVACGTHVIQLWDLRRIRNQLSTIGLDWNRTAYPPDGVDARVPIQLEVDQGILAPSHGGS